MQFIDYFQFFDHFQNTDNIQIPNQSLRKNHFCQYKTTHILSFGELLLHLKHAVCKKTDFGNFDFGNNSDILEHGLPVVKTI